MNASVTVQFHKDLPTRYLEDVKDLVAATLCAMSTGCSHGCTKPKKRWCTDEILSGDFEVCY